MKPGPNAKGAQNGVSFGRVLLLVVPLAIVALVVFVAYVFGGLSFMDSFFKPAFVQTKGVVYWNGEIVKGASIETEHESKGVRGASGFVKSDGTFVLQTMVNGEFRDGAYAGKHKVTVRQVDRTAPVGAMMPPPGSPEKYLDFKTTDLEIEVSRDPSKNDFRLEMTGTGPKGQTNSKEEAEAAKAKAAAAAAEPKLGPAELAKKILEDNDQDKDGKLAESEQRGIPIQYQRGLSYADANKDGLLDEEEIKKMVTVE